MSAPDRPTREQVDAAMARTDRAATNRDWWRRVTKNEVVQDAVWLSAEVRVLRAELDALSDEDRAEQIAALIVDKVRAQVARTPQPAQEVRDVAQMWRSTAMVPGPPVSTLREVWPGLTGGLDRLAAAVLDESPRSAAPLPAVPDGEDG